MFNLHQDGKKYIRIINSNSKVLFGYTTK